MSEWVPGLIRRSINSVSFCSHRRSQSGAMWHSQQLLNLELSLWGFFKSGCISYCVHQLRRLDMRSSVVWNGPTIFPWCASSSASYMSYRSVMGRIEAPSKAVLRSAHWPVRTHKGRQDRQRHTKPSVRDPRHKGTYILWTKCQRW